MARTSDLDNIALWQRRLADFDSSSLTVSQFCQSIACSVASFYQWRRKLSSYSHPQTNRAAGKSAKSGTAFLPVKVLPGGHGSLSALAGALVSAPVVVTLPNGTRIELACDAQAALLSILQQQESV
jgi:hypothetical protein